jgi:tetratricopeptide (TPR) repeat protein
MAQRGLWQEALFRFNEAERLDPQNAHVQNNLGVAYEAAGNFDQALKHYKRALEIAPSSREAKANYARFVEFYQSFKPKEAKPGDKKAAAKGTAAPGAPGAPGTTPPRQPPVPRPGGADPGAPGEPAVPGAPQPPLPPNTPPRGTMQPPPGAEPLPVPPPPPATR